MIKQLRCLLSGLLLMMGSSLTFAQGDWNPSNPPEPSAKYKITVSSSPNYGYTSGGGWYQEGQQTWISTSSYDTSYKFRYWTKNGEKYSEQQSFYYTVGTENVAFMAIYEYDPASPAEPQGIVSYRLYLKSDLAGSCSFNYNSGQKIQVGSGIYIAAYVNQGYKFRGWYAGDDKISESASFYYQMPANDVTLTAHLEYSPYSPDDPQSAAGQPVVPKIRGKNYTRVYGDDNPVFEYSTNTDITGVPTISCEATRTSPVGTYPITIGRGSVEGEDLQLIDGTLTITPASLVVQGGNYTKKQGQDNPEFTLTYSGFKNGEKADVLTTMPSVTCDATTTSEPGEYEVVVSGGEATNYTITCVNGKLTVVEADAIVISANNLTRVYGEDNPELTWTVSDGVLTGVPEISCEATKTSPVGTYDIVISKGTVSNFNDTYIKGTLTITKAPLQIKVGNYSKKQGEVNPSFAATYEGFKNNENESVLTKKPTISCSATNDSPIGEYDIIVSGAEAKNYDITYANGKLDISEAPVTVTAKSYTRVYGEANPSFGFSSVGGVLNGTPQITCEATASSPVGTYAIVIAKGNVTNNLVTYTNGTLTITKAPLKIKVGEYKKKQGEDNPEFTAAYEGFKNGETADVLTAKPTIRCDATKNSPAGEYKVAVSGAEAKNYEISYVDGKLTIETVTFVAGGDDNKDEDDAATYQIVSQDGTTTPTVAITDDTNVSGKFTIPEEVKHNNVTYKVTDIANGAFENNTILTEVTIPSSITSIGNNAFKGCSNLESITIYVATPINLNSVAATRSIMTRALGTSVFDGVNKATCILYVPEGSVELYKTAPVWSEFQNIQPISTTGIKELLMKDGEVHDIYDLQGRKVKANATSIDGLPKGVYIMNGKKIILR